MKKRRERTERRVRERDAKRLVRDREQLAGLEPGGAPERPIRVESSSVIDVRARAMRCPQCEGECKIVEHRAERVEGVSLRAIDVECLLCGAPRTRWFKIEPALQN